jgi:hypothetical protein
MTVLPERRGEIEEKLGISIPKVLTIWENWKRTLQRY